jgi:hypothetical protein
MLVLVFVFPILLGAFDHHGAERLPDHEHSVPLGQPTPAHAHGFTQPHEHMGLVPTDALSVVVLLSQTERVAGALSLAQSLAFPGLFVMVLFCTIRVTQTMMKRSLNDQTRFAPPTPPPARLASSC